MDCINNQKPVCSPLKRPRQQPLLIKKSWSLPLDGPSLKKRKFVPIRFGRHEIEEIKKYVNSGEKGDHSLSKYLEKEKSLYLRREITGLSYSIQVFLNKDKKINIIVHLKPKKLLGRGSFKLIRKSKLLNLENDKIIDCATATPIYLQGEPGTNQNKKMEREIRVLSILRNKRGIINMIDWCYYKIKGTKDPKLNIVFSRASCDLVDALINSMTMTPQMILDLVWGLFNIHTLGYVHGDLKPENILVLNGRLFITDFGSFHNSNNPLMIGTPEYHSPGMNRYIQITFEHQLRVSNCIPLVGFQNDVNKCMELKSIVGQSSDVFALGMIFYIILTQKTVPWFDDIDRSFDYRLPEELIEARQHNQKVIEEGYEQLLIKHPAKKRSRLLQVVLDMLNPDDFKRPKVPEILLRMQNIFPKSY